MGVHTCVDFRLFVIATFYAHRQVPGEGEERGGLEQGRMGQNFGNNRH